jgi:DNA anti-recombination protein RmuC
MEYPIIKIYSAEHQREILLDVQHVENENRRLRNRVNEISKINYQLGSYNNSLQAKIKQSRQELNELAGDYYRTMGRLINEKNIIRNKIHDLVFDYKEEIPDGLYVKIMESLM